MAQQTPQTHHGGDAPADCGPARPNAQTDTGHAPQNDPRDPVGDIEGEGAQQTKQKRGPLTGTSQTRLPPPSDLTQFTMDFCTCATAEVINGGFFWKYGNKKGGGINQTSQLLMICEKLKEKYANVGLGAYSVSRTLAPSHLMKHVAECKALCKKWEKDDINGTGSETVTSKPSESIQWKSNEDCGIQIVHSPVADAIKNMVALIRDFEEGWDPVEGKADTEEQQQADNMRRAAMNGSSNRPRKKSKVDDASTTTAGTDATGQPEEGKREGSNSPGIDWAHVNAAMQNAGTYLQSAAEDKLKQGEREDRWLRLQETQANSFKKQQEDSQSNTSRMLDMMATQGAATANTMKEMAEANKAMGSGMDKLGNAAQTLANNGCKQQ